MDELPGERLPPAAEIIAKGKVEIRIKRMGILQRHEFIVKRKMGPAGEYPYLFLDKFIDLSELVRVAEECGLPVSVKNGTAFPRGKTASDFAHLLK